MAASGAGSKKRAGSVVFPGDTFTAKEITKRKGKTRIGIGLTPSMINTHENESKEAILVTRAGVLQSKPGDTPKLWIANRQRRYIPYPEDRVIGIITRRTLMYYHVDINGPCDGLLGVLEFEGATKRNKPELNVGDIVFCRVCVANRDMQPILSCKSPSFNKSWVSGEALFMQLKDGYMFECSLNCCHRLNLINSPHLQFVAKFFAFELAIGGNGRIWCQAANTKYTLLLSNILKNGEYLSMQQFQIMVHSLLKQYGVATAQ
mmetsp:Transcript_48632/g.77795  ORF Transcript_48632/g.77795 Transcript_48632/m.77795 type:complete len:262 (-) Transcript_48632:43-828(-)|eukprot:CAMPEP_0197027240 /NCGR_PEP_ID=MMETSP1384-20130603/7190_1 /TAXON_ID=29189 /ORGANISM="Ammonia sp." /LENGTH=261 /DNA_ID=CAMNT_0042456053 /DNA_START=22 /DNA_END=807 /DNA_ORIENTATION=+